MNWESKKNCRSEVGKESENKKAEETKLENLVSKSEFENIHTWLETQINESHNSFLCDPTCDCCESEDVHYACVDVPQMARQNSETSLLSCESFSFDSLSEESYYSLQLRKDSKTLFR